MIIGNEVIGNIVVGVHVNGKERNERTFHMTSNSYLYLVENWLKIP